MEIAPVIAAVCLLIPSIVLVLIRSKLFPKQEKFYHKVLKYLISILIINGLILLLLLTFFTDGDHLIFNLNHQMDFALKYGILAIVLAVAIPFAEKGFRIKHISVPVKVVAFLLICVLIFKGLNVVLQPVWEPAEYNPTYGIYLEPENTIETLFVGTSHIRSGISPMELYKNYGICAYDISTSGQPTVASYYWIEEIYRLNKETLDTVVYDVSSLRKGYGISNYQIALDLMHLSSTKMRAVGEYSENFSEFLTNLVPLFSYHDRWKELSDTDFMSGDEISETYLRGYHFTTSQWIGGTSVRTPLLIADNYEDDALFDEKELEYFDKMISFCEEHNIRLVLIKTPTDWSSGEHNAVQILADDYGLDFIDFNVEPYYSGINFELSANVEKPADVNNLHANYYGAIKITDYMGDYLIEECNNRDVRENENYAFMDEELEEYNRYIIKAQLGEIVDPAEYLTYLLNQEDYEIFISLKDDGSASLTKEQREYFATIGLEKLSLIEIRDSYLAVLDDGVVVTEDSEKYNENEITDALSITTEGTMEDGTAFSLTSGGGTSSAISSCILDGNEYSVNHRGLNFVVYDKKLGEVVDSTVFDTYASSTRKPLNVESALSSDLNAGIEYSNLSDDEQKLYQYDMLVNADMAEKTSGDDGLLNYLSYFWNSDDYSIFIAANGDASQAFSDEVRDFLADIGLKELSDLQYRDSYIAIISDREIWVDMKSSGTEPIEADGPGYTVISGCNDTDNISSIIINSAEQSPDKRGLNIVVMSNLDSSVVSSMAFDTYEVTPSIPENWPA